VRFLETLRLIDGSKEKAAEQLIWAETMRSQYQRMTRRLFFVGDADAQAKICCTC